MFFYQISNVSDMAIKGWINEQAAKNSKNIICATKNIASNFAYNVVIMTKKFFLRVGVVNSFSQFSESPSTSSTFWRAHSFCEIMFRILRIRK